MAGNLNTTVPVKTEDEIGYLSSSFNSMTGVLRDFVQKMETANQSIEMANKSMKNELEIGQRVQSIYLMPKIIKRL